MSLSAAVIDALLASGATAEQLAAAMKASLAEQEARIAEKRAKDAARQRKSRSGRKMSQDVTVTPRDDCDTVSPNEYISNPHPESPSPDGDAPLSDFSVRVVEIWNGAIAGTPLPKAKQLTPERRKHLKARLRDHSEADVELAIRNMAASDFHSGRSGKWTEGNLGWLLKSPENFTKMLERATTSPAHQPAKPISDAEHAERMARLREKGIVSDDPPPTPPPRREGTSTGSLGQFLPQQFAGSA